MPSQSDISEFARIVGASHVLTSADDVAPYNEDWLKHYRGTSRCVLRPSSTREVSAILAHCHAHRVAVVPHGGNTGLVGGAAPVAGEVVLSLSRLRGIESFDEDAGVVTCGAGTVLESLDDYLKDRGFTVPLDLGAKGSCHIGGNVSTNAGGLRLLRWGNLHGSVVGLEVVSADGSVLNMLSTHRKDNVGFDVKQLFIGAEGALGVVTRVALLAPRRPAARNVAVLAVPSWAASRALLKAAKGALGEILSAAEFVDAAAIQLSLEQNKTSSPFKDHPAFYFFIETMGSNDAHDVEKLSAFLEQATDAAMIADGVVAADSNQATRLFALREDTPLGIARRGHVLKYDISLRLEDMYRLVEVTRSRLDERGWTARGVIAVGYGHIGDGNIHLNVSLPGRPEWAPQVEADLDPWVYEWVIQHGGSVSAEHGVGLGKRDWLPKSRSPAVVKVMRAIKDAMDPHGILNPGKVLG